MRATTFSTPNVSRATRAAMMLVLSPLLQAANAWAQRLGGVQPQPWSPDYAAWSAALPAGSFDAVVANILSNPLKVLAPPLQRDHQHRRERDQLCQVERVHRLPRPTCRCCRAGRPAARSPAR